MDLFRPQKKTSSFWHLVGRFCKARSRKLQLSAQTPTRSAAWPRDATSCSLTALAHYFGQWGWVVRPGIESDRCAFDGLQPAWVVEAPDGERHLWTFHGFDSLADIHRHWSWAGPILWRTRCAEAQLKAMCDGDPSSRQAVWDWIMAPERNHPRLADALRGGAEGGAWATATPSMAPRRFDTAVGAGLHDGLRLDLLAHLHALGFHGHLGDRVEASS